MASKVKQLPKNWPNDGSLEYLVRPKYSNAVTPSLQASLHGSITSAKDLLVSTPAAPNGLVRITPITSPSHPANGQYGLFATRLLPADSLIILYLGLVHSASDTDQASDYDLSMDRELGIGIDASRCGNEARFINDYRGVAERPIAELRDCWVRAGAGYERRVGVFVRKDCKKGIAKGQEILISYGKGFWHERKHDEAQTGTD